MPSEKRSWGARLVYLFVNRLLLNANTRMLYAFVPVFVVGMALTEGQYFNALAIAGIFALITPAIIPLAETKGRRFAMGVATIMFAIGNFIVVLFHGFWIIALGLGVSTLGLAIFQSTCQAYVGDETPFAKRGRYVAVLELAWSASYFIMMPILSVVMSSAAADNALWKAPFLILGVLSLASFLLLKVMIPYTPPPKSVQESGDKGLKLILSTLKSPHVFVALCYGFFIQAGAEYMNLTYASWLDSAWGVQIATLGIVAAIFGAAEFFGEFSVVSVSDRVGKKNMCGIGNCISAVAGILAPFIVGVNSWAAIIVLAVFYIGFEISIASGFSVMTQVVPALRASFMGIFAAVLQLGRIVADFTCNGILGADGRFQMVAWIAAICFVLAFVFLRFVKVQPEENDEAVA